MSIENKKELDLVYTSKAIEKYTYTKDQYSN
jgi:hypothetical protein